MSNFSLKEQLASLGLASKEGEKVQPNKNNAKNNNANKKKPEPGKKQKPAWLEQAQYGIELLKAFFPACFKESKEIQPLKIGIKQDLVKYLSTREDIVIGDKACMVTSLSYYVNSPSYHKQVVLGATRIDLEGNAAGVVSSDEAQYSEETRQNKLQKKKQPQSTENKVENDK